jgi:hypothetical protein
MRKKLKHAFILTFFVLTYSQSFSLNEHIRVGFFASPGVSWSKPAGSELNQGKPRFGVDYGFMVEYWFARNYGLTTGLHGAFDGCNISNRTAFKKIDTLGNVLRSANEKYGFHYVVLPAYLKLKTNEIKDSKFVIWGQLGVDLQITVNARATYSDSIGDAPSYWVEKENILRPKNEVANAVGGFRSNFIDVRLGAGAGFEYNFDDQASLLVGIHYHNGFINNILDKNADAKKEPNVMRFISLRVGVLF